MYGQLQICKSTYTRNAHLDEYLSGDTFPPLIVTELSTKTTDLTHVNSDFVGSFPNLAAMKMGMGAMIQKIPTASQAMYFKGST